MLSDKEIVIANFAFHNIRQNCFEEDSPMTAHAGEKLIKDLCNSLFKRGATIEEIQVIMKNNGFDMVMNVKDVDELTMKRLKKTGEM
ncbi:TPA: hypothetical protein ACGXM3_005392 [Bacillus cereus]